MPQRKRVARSGLTQQSFERVGAAILEVESFEFTHKGFGRVFEVRSSRTDTRTCLAHRVTRDVHLAPVAYQRYPAQCDVKEGPAGIIDLEGVLASKIYRLSRGGIHKE